MNNKKIYKDSPKSPCCGIKMRHVPDNILYNFECPRCGIEYELDEKTDYFKSNPQATNKLGGKYDKIRRII